ncbi:MAG: hypothetical protein IJR61_04940, partial [Clostridia bacterium]|nr:hypothetical protein [Clostridia bacterium]
PPYGYGRNDDGEGLTRRIEIFHHNLSLFILHFSFFIPSSRPSVARGEIRLFLYYWSDSSTSLGMTIERG